MSRYEDSSNFARPEQPPQPRAPLTDSILSRSKTYREEIRDLKVLAANTRERLFGPADPDGEKTPTVSPVANGFSEQFDEVADDIGHGLMRLRAVLEEINGRV